MTYSDEEIERAARAHIRAIYGSDFPIVDDLSGTVVVKAMRAALSTLTTPRADNEELVSLVTKAEHYFNWQRFWSENPPHTPSPLARLRELLTAEWVLTSEQSEAFVRALENPPEPKAALRQAATPKASIPIGWNGPFRAIGFGVEDQNGRLVCSATTHPRAAEIASALNTALGEVA